MLLGRRRRRSSLRTGGLDYARAIEPGIAGRGSEGHGRLAFLGVTVRSFRAGQRSSNCPSAGSPRTRGPQGGTVAATVATGEALVEFLVLGPFEVKSGGEPLSPAGQSHAPCWPSSSSTSGLWSGRSAHRRSVGRGAAGYSRRSRPERGFASPEGHRGLHDRDGCAGLCAEDRRRSGRRVPIRASRPRRHAVAGARALRGAARCPCSLEGAGVHGPCVRELPAELDLTARRAPPDGTRGQARRRDRARTARRRHPRARRSRFTGAVARAAPQAADAGAPSLRTHPGRTRRLREPSTRNRRSLGARAEHRDEGAATDDSPE